MMFDVNWVGQIPLLMAPPAADGSAPPAWVQILPLAILFVLMYFVLLRPQMKRQKETEKLIQSIKTGDRVLAAGGIYGTDADKVAVEEGAFVVVFCLWAVAIVFVGIAE